ncbi:MAG: hypothetical protein HKN23_13845 [Verrucomicrobiales bacterium]|nr:hypothetical protein [Verrucomicrobiales bacterium]
MRLLAIFLALTAISLSSLADELLAGVAKVDITHPKLSAGDNPLFAKALVLKSGETTAVLVTIDAVAIAEIGNIKDPFLANVRAALAKNPGIDPKSLIVNASHCHGVVAPDVEARTVRAVREAFENLVPVHAGTGAGLENRVQENRRLLLKNGKESDVRHAYALPPNDAVAAVGPVDPEIGILKLDHADTGEPFAIVYNFACHPIQGAPSGGNTADLSGFASKAIEESLGGDVVALFVQGCGGDINPAYYKDVNRPHDGRPLGNQLALSVLKALHEIETKPEAKLKIVNETLDVPRADHSKRIGEMETEITDTLTKISGTSLNLDTFLPLFVKYHLDPNSPSYSSHRYLQDEYLENQDWKTLDARNINDMKKYVANIRLLEEFTRQQVNLALLNKHQKRFTEEKGKPVETEVAGLRVGDFRMVTFPAEVTVEVGLNIKNKSPHKSTFVAGYTNGYLYYAPTKKQAQNRGGAQEDSDCMLAPEWQDLFETKVAEILKGL